MHFLSKRSIDMHKEYLKDIKLRISVFEKSYPDASGAKISDIKRLRLLRSERDELFRLRCEELLHEVYFSSFCECGGHSELIRKQYGSEASFLYKLMRECMEKSGFLVIYKRAGDASYYIGEKYDILENIMPLLAVDLCEHSYLLDYGFNKQGYLKYALNSLDLSKI